MPVNFDLSAYVNPVQPLPNIDITGAYRQWQEHHLNEQRLNENKRQFDQSEARQSQQFGQEMGHKNRVSNDINSRFGLELGDKTTSRSYEQANNKYKQQQALLAKARAAAAESRWNEVESYMGTLTALGANVSKTTDTEGRPSYRLQEGPAPDTTGETFHSSIAKINENRTGSNPFDTSLGTVSQSATDKLAPEVAPNPAPDAQQVSAQPPTTLTGSGTQEQTEQPPTTSESSGTTAGSQSYDPYAIDASQIQKMNSLRMDPLLAGIEGAFPNRFQPQIRSLTGGMRALGASPEGTLDMMQKPMDTAARLMGAELGAEGQMARASIGQGGQTSTEARLRENEAVNRAETKAKQTGLYDTIKNSQQFNSIRERIASGNPNAQADAMKELIGLREGGRITEQDFVIGVQGIASNIDQLKSQIQGIYQSGLKEFQTYNILKMLDIIQKNNSKRLKQGAADMSAYADSFRYEPEVYGVKNWIRGNLPKEYWPENIQKFDPQENAGGRQVRSPAPSKPSVSVSAPATRDVNQEALDLFNEVENQ